MSEQEKNQGSAVEGDEIYTFIDGKTIALAPLNQEHVEIYTRWINSEKVRMYSRNEVPRSVDEIKKWFEPKGDGPKEDIGFEIWHKEDQKLIGFCGLNNINYFHSFANLYMEIGEVEYWNQGIATEATKLIIEYGFLELNMNKIYVEIFSPNIGSIKAAKKAGFIHEATLKQQIYVEGDYVDVERFCLLKDKWMEKNQKSSEENE
jgi:RimJ/RimL family protein N-acetyltransferase